MLSLEPARKRRRGARVDAEARSTIALDADEENDGGMVDARREDPWAPLAKAKARDGRFLDSSDDILEPTVDLLPAPPPRAHTFAGSRARWAASSRL